MTTRKRYDSHFKARVALEVTVYHMWDESTVGVSSIDHDSGIMTFLSPTGHPAGAFNVKKYVIWNLRQGMTRPGQWYLDRATGKLVYWPLPCEDMAKASVIVPTNESIIQIQGQREEPVKNITIECISLSVTTTPYIPGNAGVARWRWNLLFRRAGIETSWKFYP